MKKPKLPHYEQGYCEAWGEAMGALIRQNGKQGEEFAKEIMACHGISVEDLETAGIDPIDLIPIRDGYKAYDKHMRKQGG